MSTVKYSFPARVLHWVMAFGFVFMWGCGYVMTTLVAEDGPLEELLFDLHITVGVTLIVVLVVRIAVRTFSPPPPLPRGMPPWERTGAHLGHAALYALPAIVMTLGWAEVELSGHTIKWFGYALPTLSEADEAWSGRAEFLHRWLAYLMLAVAVVHVAAVAKHRWLDRRDVLGRML